MIVTDHLDAQLCRPALARDSVAETLEAPLRVGLVQRVVTCFHFIHWSPTPIPIDTLGFEIWSAHVCWQQTWLASVAPLPLDVLLAEALSVTLSVQRAGEAAGARRALWVET